jgi:hypothetical protein
MHGFNERGFEQRVLLREGRMVGVRCHAIAQLYNLFGKKKHFKKYILTNTLSSIPSTEISQCK